MLSMVRCSLVSWTLAVTMSRAVAHPLFNGQVVSQADGLLSEYDYVIVGAGASGLTVANRLSEQRETTVLVIEAGQLDQDEDFINIPGLAGGAVGTKYDWNDTYAASEFVAGRSLTLPQGRIVGGSTNLNRMVFDRGSKSDYDSWETLGNKGWNWNSLLPYFKKNEKFSPPTKEIQKEYNMTWDQNAHGTNGLVHSTYSEYVWPTTKNLIGATKSLNIPITKDQANGNAIGGFFTPSAVDPIKWQRSSADEAYYESAVKRPNFHLIAGQQATRVLTSSANGSVKATGVEYAASSNAERQNITAKREVIIAAGTLRSPQLLQVSGVGDSALLSSINVPTVVDLPAVGQNLHDHVLLPFINTVNTTLTLNSQLTSNETFFAEARAQYNSQRGPLISPPGAFLLFLPVSTYTDTSKSIHAAALAADASISLPPGTPAEVAKGYAAAYAAINSKILAKDSAFLELIWSDGSLFLGLQHVYSRGNVKAASSSIFDKAISDAGILRNPLDIQLLREAVRFARRLSAQPSIVELNAVEVAPGASVTSDADIDQYIKGSATSLFHPAGTCKMGKREEGGVVDGELRVYGVKGLRVVDASIIPILPATHTMTTVYAVAERAADFIKAAAKAKDYAWPA